MECALPLLKFRCPDLDRHFSGHGYCVTPLLDAAGVRRLEDCWASRADVSLQAPYAVSLASPSMRYRVAMSNAVTREIAPLLAPLLPDARLVYAGFACKRASEPASAMPLHQDPAFVDEMLWASGNIWIALRDVGPEDGPLWVVPGSHRLNRGWRAFNQPFAYPALESRLRDMAVPLYMRRGEAVIFPHSLCHFSPPNRSALPRLAAGGLLVQAGAPLHYCFADPDDRAHIAVYDFAPRDFLRQPVSGRPSTGIPHIRPAMVAPPDAGGFPAA